MLLSAFNSTSVFSAGTGSSSGFPGSSTDNAIAKFVGTTGSQIESSGILIDDFNNLLMLSVNENAIVLRRWGSVGTKTDPTFAYGRIVPDAAGRPVIRTLYSGVEDTERTLSQQASDGSLTLYPQSNGADHFTIQQGSRVNPFGTFTTDAGTGWYYYSPVADEGAKAFVGLLGVETVAIRTGPSKAGMLTRVEINEDHLKLFSGLNLRMTESLSHPAAPPVGEYKIYPKGEDLFLLDSSNIPKALTPQPVVSHEGTYDGPRGNGFIKNGDTYSNVAQFVVPFDAEILYLDLHCESTGNEWRIDILLNGSTTPYASFVVPSASTQVTVSLPGVIFSKDDRYSLRLQKGVGGSGAGQNIDSPKASIYLRKRVN